MDDDTCTLLLMVVHFCHVFHYFTNFNMGVDIFFRSRSQPKNLGDMQFFFHP
jgi:hypothetical protein